MLLHQHAVALASGLALVAGLLAPIHASAAGRHDSLNSAEWQAACDRALGDFNDMMVAEESAATVLDCLPRGLARRALRGQQELLLIERRPPPKSMPAKRQADVYFYNYKSNVLHHFVVDVTTRKRLSHTKMRDTQLPLTQAEIDRAAELAIADRPIARRIAEQYQGITGELMHNFDQVDVKAFAFHSSTIGGTPRGQIKRCGRHRCAQLSLSVRGIAMELQPVVDLSRSRVFNLADALPTPARSGGHH